MRAVRMLTLPLLIMLAVPARASSQTLSSRAIEEINAAALVRVQLTAGKRGLLYAPQADSTSLRYERSHGLQRGGSVVQLAPPLAVADVVEIQRPIGNNAGHGAKIGAAIGLGLSLLAVAAASSDPWAKPTTGEAVGVTVFWTSIGAGIGALIGNGSKRWETVYRAP